MKTFFLSAIALAAGVVGTATDCNLESIKSVLEKDTKVAVQMADAEAGCIEETGIDIFAITDFPTKENALKAQASEDCSTLINLVNGHANIDTQCTLLVNDTIVNYGRLISDFLDGKTGNETDSSSDSASESKSASSSASESDSSGSSSNSLSASASTSGASTTALSFMTSIAVGAIAIALR